MSPKHSSPVTDTDLLARLRDFVAAESKRWVNCGTGELERIEVSPAGKLAQEAVEAIESATSRPSIPTVLEAIGKILEQAEPSPVTRPVGNAVGNTEDGAT